MRFTRFIQDWLGFIAASTAAGGAVGSLVGTVDVGLAHLFSSRPRNKDAHTGEDAAPPAQPETKTPSLGKAIAKGAKTGCAVGFIGSTAPISLPMMFWYMQRDNQAAFDEIRENQAKIAAEAPAPLPFLESLRETQEKARELRERQAEIARQNAAGETDQKEEKDASPERFFRNRSR